MKPNKIINKWTLAVNFAIVLMSLQLSYGQNGDRQAMIDSLRQDFQLRMMQRYDAYTGNKTDDEMPTRIPNNLLPTSYDWYVSTEGNDNNAGTVNAPLRTIQAAINKASLWQTIKVANGHYLECINIPTNKGVKLFGNPNSPESVIIDGNGQNATVKMINCRYNSSFCGFTITGGAYNDGAGFFCQNAGLDLSDMIITGNHSASVAAIGIQGVGFTVSNVLVYGNTGATAIDLYECDNLELDNTTIVDNNVTDQAIKITNGFVPFFNHNIIRNPVASNEITADHYLFGFFELSDILGGTTRLLDLNNVDYFLVSDIIDVDPLFVNPAAGKYQLKEGSPCIDAGSTWIGSNDINLPPSRGTARCDLGMYGGKVSAQPYQNAVEPTVPDLPAVTVSPSVNRNYIHTIVPLIETASIPAGARSPSHYSETIQYFDGLGRPLQTVAVGASSGGKDIVTPIEYDNLGREAKRFLPFEAITSANGAYRANVFSEQQTFYNGLFGATEKAWSETDFEPSPLNRIQKEIGPGKDWHGTNWKNNGKYVSYSYRTNFANELSHWSDLYQDIIHAPYNYPAGTLHVIETINEDGRKIIEYIDMTGRTVRQKQWVSSYGNNDVYAITDFVYDVYGRLRFVLPPAIEKPISLNGTGIDIYNVLNYIYIYYYDNRGRLVEKHIPGAGWTYIIYNKLDQPIMTQDADQCIRKEWSFTKYDAHGRVAYTGLLNTQIHYEILQNLANSTNYTQWETRASGSEWTTTAFPNSGNGTITVLTTNYYDNYNFPGKDSYTAPFLDTRVQGLQTGSKVKVLETTPYDVATTIYYDSKGRVIHTIVNQPKVENVAVKDEITNTYNFTGQLLTTIRKHSKGGATMFNLTTTNEYDHTGRLKTVLQDIGNGNVTVTENTYNALGQLIQTTLHEGLDSIRYAYNIRGWLTKIESEKFKGKLRYQDVESSMGNTPQWSGNISAMEWKANTWLNEYWHAYKFTYDNLNRLTAGDYTRSATSSDVTITYGTDNGKYNENYEYNIMGNITALNRYHGNASVKEKEYAYNYTNTGNRVNQTVNTATYGSTSNYTYNSAGRLFTDSGKGINQIDYNHLGLPVYIKYGNAAYQELKYTYDGLGRKLKKQTYTYTPRYYVDGVEYNGANIHFIQTPYGRIRRQGLWTNDWVFDYFLKDHLGSVRTVLTSEEYYPVRYIATMEEDRAAEENQYFENVEATRADMPYNYPGRTPTNTKVSKVPGKSEGLKITLRVMPGDTIEISAKAFYNMDNSFAGNNINVAPIIGAALAGMTNPTNTVVGETSQTVSNFGANTGGSAGSAAGLSQLPEKNNQNNLVKPKSGINFVLYNNQFDVVEANTGYLPVDDRINTIQNLATDRMVMTENGYIDIFVNNDAQTPVYYDNLRVTVSAGTLTEVNAYYPFGSPINDLYRCMCLNDENDYKYNGKEQQNFYDWLDYGARMYDPVVARWWTPDPLAEKYYSTSPYAYCLNNPVRFIDPDGMEIENTRESMSAFFSALFSTYFIMSSLEQNNSDGRFDTRIAGLRSSLGTMNTMANSNNVYSFIDISGIKKASGDFTYDPEAKKFVISFISSPNLIHEITHAGQYEEGEVGFWLLTDENGQITVQSISDIFDEINAYRAEHAYSPIAGIKHAYDINTKFVHNLRNANGYLVYAPGGRANISQERLDSNSQFFWFRVGKAPVIKGVRSAIYGEHPLDGIRLNQIQEALFNK